MTATTASVPLVRRKPPAAVRRKQFLFAVANHSLLIATALMFLAPFLFIVLTSLMTNNQALSSQLWPHPFRFQNFADVFHQAPLLRWTLNTMIYSVLGTIGVLVSSVPVAYALARIRWRGREVAFMFVLIALMLPPQVTVVPLYVMWSKLHPFGFDFVGTLWPVIIPNWFGDAFSIFLLRQFFRQLPQEMFDSAAIDGAGHIGMFWRLVLPLSKPVLGVVVLFSFISNWTDFINPLIYLSDPSMYTLMLGQYNFFSGHNTFWSQLMASNVMILAPLVILFFFTQRLFIEGVTFTGLRG